MSEIIPIGRCIGCDRMAGLDERVCHDCLASPRRGRKWAEVSHRCRREPAFAAAVYQQLTTPAARDLFRRMYGVPKRRRCAFLSRAPREMSANGRQPRDSAFVYARPSEGRRMAETRHRQWAMLGMRR